jgi:PhnB protein
MRIPPGFHPVAPCFFVGGAATFLEFLFQGLGGLEVGRHVNGHRIANVQVRRATSTVMVSEASSAFAAMPASCYQCVESADEAMIGAIAAGGHQGHGCGEPALRRPARCSQRPVRKPVVDF